MEAAVIMRALSSAVTTNSSKKTKIKSFLFSPYKIRHLKSHLCTHPQHNSIADRFVAARGADVLNTWTDIQPWRYLHTVIKLKSIFIIIAISRRGLVAENALSKTYAEHIIVTVFSTRP